MATVIQIAYILHKGFIKYVPKSRIKGYEKGFATRKRFDTKFIVNFFTKYVDFDKWVNKPKEPYDEYLFDYWLYDVPALGVVATDLLWKFRRELKKDFKNKKDKPKTIKKPKQTKQESKDWFETPHIYFCGDGGCEIYEIDQKLIPEVEYQSKEEVLYRKDGTEKKYKIPSKKDIKEIDKYKAMLRAMTPEMRKELGGYIQKLEENENPKAKELIKNPKEKQLT